MKPHLVWRRPEEWGPPIRVERLAQSGALSWRRRPGGAGYVAGALGALLLGFGCGLMLGLWTIWLIRVSW